jgi:hypothetical protein
MLHGRRTEDIVHSMSENLANVVGSLQQEMLALRNQVHSYQENYENSIRVVTEVCSTLRTTLQTSVNRQESSTRSMNLVLDKLTLLEKKQSSNHIEMRQLANRRRLPPPVENDRQQPTVAEANVDGGAPAADVALVGDRDVGAIPNEIAPVPLGVAATAMALRLGMDATQLLLPSPRQPAVSQEFPLSWITLVEEWNRNDLESFRHSRRSEWTSNAVIMRYNKRVRAMDQLRKMIRQTRQNTTDAEMAARLDNERVVRNLTLSKHLNHLHTIDTTILRRVRRDRNDNHDNNDNNDNNIPNNPIIIRNLLVQRADHIPIDRDNRNVLIGPIDNDSPIRPPIRRRLL